MPDETTMRIFRRDALLLKQMQNMLEMEKRGMTQAQLMHEMLDFMLGNADNFFKEVEMHRKRNEKMMEEWTRFMLKRMRQNR